MFEIPYWVIVTVFSLVMAPGVALVFFPVFPATLYLLVMSVIFGFVDKFHHLTVGNLLVLVGFFIVGIIVDNLSGVLTSKLFGASGKSALLGLVGFFIGLIVFPPLGGVIGLFLAVLISEIVSGKSHTRALTIASGSALGFFIGTILSFCVALGFFITFVILSIH
ncbi:MAG: DUF456 domain-containing protein [bacterium]